MYVSSSSRRSHKVCAKCAIELLDTNRHVEAIERVLHDEIGVELVAPADHDIRIGLLRACE
jgi:hypothetical protein